MYSLLRCAVSLVLSHLLFSVLAVLIVSQRCSIKYFNWYMWSLMINEVPSFNFEVSLWISLSNLLNHIMENAMVVLSYHIMPCYATTVEWQCVLISFYHTILYYRIIPTYCVKPYCAIPYNAENLKEVLLDY